MADKKIKFTVGEVCGAEGIVADPPVVVVKNKNTKLKFENELGFDATVYFYKLEEKGGTAILNVCEGVETDGALKVPADETKDCKLNENVSYSYTVAAPPLLKLDPIIIIEDSFAADSASWIPMFFIAVLGAAVGAFGAHMRMKAKMK